MRDSRVHQGWWATLAAAIVILTVGCTISGVGIAQQDDPSQPLHLSAAEPGPGIVATPESVPHFTVTAPRTHPAAQRNLQKWADDVADGDLATLTRKCWTFASERVVACTPIRVRSPQR